ncbi:MAG: flagellar biosynthetic protein FliR [Gammaproteobacteria bacterium]|nr:MAG: flagellar biosynthetic protein FliR [Gammaproteobacteria bacterium]
MQLGEQELLAWINAVLWPFVRIGALLLAAPLFGARTVPVRARVLLALTLALIVAPGVDVPADTQPLSAAGALLLVREVVIGASMGFLLQLVFGAMAMAGEIVALSMGLAFASMVDPERGVSVPLVGQYFVIFATLLFLTFDGHLALLTLLFESFQLLPPAASGLPAGGFWQLVGWGSAMFEAAVFVALPASAALLVASVSMGLIARSAPQLNIFAVGFPMTLVLGMVTLLLVMPSLPLQLEQVLGSAFALSRTMLESWR